MKHATKIMHDMREFEQLVFASARLRAAGACFSATSCSWCLFQREFVQLVIDGVLKIIEIEKRLEQKRDIKDLLPAELQNKC